MGKRITPTSDDIPKRPVTPTPLLSVYQGLHNYVRWCTPSIHADVPQVSDIYLNDFSISLHSLGNPLTHTGVFAEACDLAARAYKADQSLFSVNGSTGSNMIVFRALRQQLGKIKLVAQRNVHKSVMVAIGDYNVDITFLPPKYDRELAIVIPSSLAEIQQCVREAQPNVLFLTNPTYEGLCLDLSSMIPALRQEFPDLIIVVDEAWGAHFPFSPNLPHAAMECGADVVVHSVHKMGSGLQQTSLIHWKEKRVSTQCMREAYRDLTSTSPSFHLLASIDGTRAFMETSGEEAIQVLLDASALFRQELAKLPGVNVIELADLQRKYPELNLMVDGTKTLIQLTHHSAALVAKKLEEKYNIVVEKYELNNIVFITPFQLTSSQIHYTIMALKEILGSKKKNGASMEYPPALPSTIIKHANPADLREAETELVSLSQALGRVVAETIVPYPPGIALVAPGEEMQAAHIKYLKECKKHLEWLTVMMLDPTLKTVRVLKKEK